jgi:hypothetical protein
MSDIAEIGSTDALFSALGEQLAAAGERYELVVIGGSGLLALGLIERATRDVDIVALRSGERLDRAEPMPAALQIARDRVARDFSLPSSWLNAGPTDLLDFGLPDGFIERLARRDYGGGLSVFLASRYDQIHFKLYALVDRGPGKHEQDLRAMDPTDAELLAAARWTRTHDPSEGYLQLLDHTLTYLEVDHADL